MEEKKVCLIGFAKTTRHLAPWDDTSYEFWGCNEGYVQDFPKIDRWFQIHIFESFSRAENPNDPNHFKWLQQEHPFEIYMKRKFQFAPSSVGYPLDELVMMFGRRYFRSSFDYMIAMALAEGYTTIGVYGFEMASGTEYEYQRPSAEYWIGRAEGMGVKIELPLNANLLRGTLYGMEDTSVGFRQQLELRKGILLTQQRDETAHFNRLHGAMIELEGIKNATLLNPNQPMDIGILINERQAQMIEKTALLNLLNGAKLEVETMINIFDGHSGTTAVEEKEKDDDKKKEISEQHSGADGTPEQSGKA